jgi:hypothetical protein
MLQLKNATPFKAAHMLLADVNGIDTIFAVVKATFTIADSVALADEQLPIVLSDEHYADPASSSIRVSSDVCLGKPGTDVLLIGSAWAPSNEPTWQMDVSVSVGPLRHTVRVFGDRVWDTRSGIASIAWVAPFVRMPLVWERAFGGSDANAKGPHIFRQNPVGSGFRASGSTQAVSGRPLPNVEDPEAPISSVQDMPAPAGFAPISPSWLPRSSYAGTYDEAWQRNRAPYLPNDFDPRFFQLARAGMVVPGYLQGGEVVDLRGVTPSGATRFTLPIVRPQVTYRRDTGSQTLPAVLDTLLIEPDANRFSLVWRSAFACDKQVLKVREVAVQLGPST